MTKRSNSFPKQFIKEESASVNKPEVFIINNSYYRNKKALIEAFLEVLEDYKSLSSDDQRILLVRKAILAAGYSLAKNLTSDVWIERLNGDTFASVEKDDLDITIPVNLRDLANKLEGKNFDSLSESEQFCKEVRQQAIDAKKTIRSATRPKKTRISAAERALAEEIKCENLPLWDKRKDTNDDLRRLPAPLYFAIVYGEWMGPNLTNKVLNEVDPGLAAGISNWRGNNGGDLPSGIVLPNEHSEAQDWVARVQAGQPVPVENRRAALSRNEQRLRRAASQKNR